MFYGYLFSNLHLVVSKMLETIFELCWVSNFVHKIRWGYRQRKCVCKFQKKYAASMQNSACVDWESFCDCVVYVLFRRWGVTAGKWTAKQWRFAHILGRRILWDNLFGVCVSLSVWTWNYKTFLINGWCCWGTEYESFEKQDCLGINHIEKLIRSWWGFLF